MAATKRDNYITGDDDVSGALDDSWRGQTFTTTETYELYSVKLKLKKQESPGDCNVSIYATSSDVPTGSPLITKTFTGTDLTTTSTWYEVVFDSTINLTSLTKYAIVWSVPGSTGNNTVLASGDWSTPTYTGGAWVYSEDSGSTWTEDTAADLMFEVWGTDLAKSDIEWTADSETVGLWHLSDLTDSSGNSNTLTNNSSTPHTDGFNGTVDGAYAIDNEGSSDSLSIGDASQTGLDIARHLTIMGWFYFDDLYNTAEGDNYLVAKSDGSSNINYALYITDAPAISFEYNVSTNKSDYITWTPSTGQWYHIAVTHNVTTGATDFYVDGVNLGATSGDAQSGNMTTNAVDFTIGCRAGGSRGADTRIDEVIIKTRDLSALEIADYYTGTVTSRLAAPGVGSVYVDTTTWDATHDATTGTAADSSLYTYSWKISAAQWLVRRLFLPFDTSDLPDSGIIIGSASVNLFIYSTPDNDDTDSVVMVGETTQDDPDNTPVVADFNTCGAVDDPTEGSDRVTMASMTADTWTTFTLDATGLDWIDQTGTTLIGARTVIDAQDDIPTGKNYVVYSSTAEEIAYLEVKYSASSQLPNIKSVNGLANASVKSVNGLAIASIKSINGLE